MSWPESYKIQVNQNHYKKKLQNYKQKKEEAFEIFPTEFKRKTIIKVNMTTSKEKPKKCTHLLALVIVKQLSIS
jgi:hypothetical protein